MPWQVKQANTPESPEQQKPATEVLAWSRDGRSFNMDQEAKGLKDGNVENLIGQVRRELAFYFPDGTKDEHLTCTSMNLSRNQLGDIAIQKLVSFVVESGISVLSLRLFRNRVTDAGAQSVCDMIRLQPEPLQELHLSHNQIAWPGAMHILSTVAESDRYPYEGERRALPLWLRMENNFIDWDLAFKHLQSEPTWDIGDNRFTPVAETAPLVVMHTSYAHQSPELAEPAPDCLEAAAAEEAKSAQAARQTQRKQGGFRAWKVKVPSSEQDQAEPVEKPPQEARAAVDQTGSKRYLEESRSYPREVMLVARQAVTSSGQTEPGLGIHSEYLQPEAAGNSNVQVIEDDGNIGLQAPDPELLPAVNFSKRPAKPLEQQALRKTQTELDPLAVEFRPQAMPNAKTLLDPVAKEFQQVRQPFKTHMTFNPDAPRFQPQMQSTTAKQVAAYLPAAKVRPYPTLLQPAYRNMTPFAAAVQTPMLPQSRKPAPFAAAMQTPMLPQSRKPAPFVAALQTPMPPQSRKPAMAKPPGNWFNLHAPEFVPKFQKERISSTASTERDEQSEEDQLFLDLAAVQQLQRTLCAEVQRPRPR